MTPEEIKKQDGKDEWLSDEFLKFMIKVAVLLFTVVVAISIYAWLL